MLLILGLVCFALPRDARAVCQQGCDTSNGNTFLGDDALVNNTTGSANTAVGAAALSLNTIGEHNTAIFCDELGLSRDDLSVLARPAPPGDRAPQRSR